MFIASHDLQIIINKEDWYQTNDLSRFYIWQTYCKIVQISFGYLLISEFPISRPQMK